MPERNETRPRVTEPAAPSGSSVFKRPYAALTWGIVLSVGMVAFESLGVATVLPGIARDLHGLRSYGWGVSALMLATIIGTVAAGHAADRRGPRFPMAVGMVVFATGCGIAGSAPTWPLFLLGRFGQGLGVGAVLAMAYTTIGLAFPAALQARMFALLSSAFTIPSLVGPVIAGTLADAVNWRAVFLLLIPLVGVAAALTLPGLKSLDPPQPTNSPRRAWYRGAAANAIVLAVGTAAFLQALLLRGVVTAAVLAVLGMTAAVVGVRQTTPRGVLGRGVLVRGLLCGAYFGSEAFLPLGLQTLRGMGATQAGIGLSAGAVAWVAGSAAQAKRDNGSRRGRGVPVGSLVLLLGIGTIATSILLTAVPSWVAILGWTIGGLGMGVAFNAATTDTMTLAPASRQGEISGALQLAQSLATAVISGLGGASLSIAQRTGTSWQTALTIVFVLTAVLALAAAAMTLRSRSGADADPAGAAEGVGV